MSVKGLFVKEGLFVCGEGLFGVIKRLLVCKGRVVCLWGRVAWCDREVCL